MVQYINHARDTMDFIYCLNDRKCIPIPIKVVDCFIFSDKSVDEETVNFLGHMLQRGRTDIVIELQMVCCIEITGYTKNNRKFKLIDTTDFPSTFLHKLYHKYQCIQPNTQHSFHKITPHHMSTQPPNQTLLNNLSPPSISVVEIRGIHI